MVKRYNYFFISVLILIGICILGKLLESYLELVNIALIHLIPIIVVALRGNYVATALISLTTIIFLDILFIPPIHSFSVHDALYLWSFAIYVLVGYIITAQAKKIQTNELREILLNTLSHDLKTPLSSILGCSTTLLLKESNLDDATKKELLCQIKQGSEKMDRLINNLLDNARLKDKQIVLKMEWCDFEDILGVALQDFDETNMQNSLKTYIDPNLKLFWGDFNLLVRLFANLLDNAFKYANQSKQISVHIEQNGREVRILFFNESSPMHEDSLKNIFEKFFRQREDVEGIGIGLFIAQSIVMAHSGAIKAFNEKNGICFEILLPILKEPKELKSEL